LVSLTFEDRKEQVPGGKFETIQKISLKDPLKEKGAEIQM